MTTKTIGITIAAIVPPDKPLLFPQYLNEKLFFVDSGSCSGSCSGSFTSCSGIVFSGSVIIKELRLISQENCSGEV